MPAARARDIPAVRILPMSDKIEGFRDRSIEDVQKRFFLRDLPTCNGRFRYPSSGLNADPWTIVLFQFRARVVASAVFLRDEKLDKPVNGHAGAMFFDPATIRTFEPIDAETMRAVWPGFRAFGHVKQHLNPARYALFKRKLKRVQSPVIRPTGGSAHRASSRAAR